LKQAVAQVDGAAHCAPGAVVVVVVGVGAGVATTAGGGVGKAHHPATSRAYQSSSDEERVWRQSNAPFVRSLYKDDSLQFATGRKASAEHVVGFGEGIRALLS